MRQLLLLLSIGVLLGGCSAKDAALEDLDKVSLDDALSYSKRGNCNDRSWPDATNTGLPKGWRPKRTYANYTMRNNEVLSDVLVTGYISIPVSVKRCTIRRCRVRGDETIGFDHTVIWFQNTAQPSVPGVNGDRTSILIENCDIGPELGSFNPNDVDCGIAGCATNCTIRNNNIHDVVRGIDAMSHSLVENNFLHEIWVTQDKSKHHDGVFIWGSSSNVTVKGNNIELLDVSNTASIFMQGAASRNVSITNNRVTGGAYAIRLNFPDNGAGLGAGICTGNRVRRNPPDPGAKNPLGGDYGPASYWEFYPAVWTNNVWDDNDEPFTPVLVNW
ncbi:hypothetical protein [Chitinophaga sp. YIM B06452]|uniref:hypothetical protein n=1 Tax=Chitinophaga sp. YIM B06452 TaxID=3082158 RepID=UPI0031FE9E4A